MDKIKTCEEVLGGVAVDWRGYEPPGGKSWRETFQKIVDVLADSRKQAEKEKERLSFGIAKTNCARNAAVKVSALADEMERSIDPATLSPKILEEAKARAAEVRMAAELFANLMNGVLAADDSTDVLRDIDEDLRFYDAFELFFEADTELDKMLFALFSVDRKYRAKIFREAYRLLSVVSTEREKLRNSKSVVFLRIKPMLDKLLETLDSAYAVTAPYMKKLRKEMAKRGNSVLDEMTKPTESEIAGAYSCIDLAREIKSRLN